MPPIAIIPTLNLAKTKNRFRPEFDGLDRRCLMAAGMTASLARGVLTIRGTDGSVVVHQIGYPHRGSIMPAKLVKGASADDVAAFRKDPRFAPYIQRLLALAKAERIECTVAYVNAA